MSSIFKKAFGFLGGGSNDAAGAPARQHEPEIYKDCSIVATPLKEGSQWRLAGTITKVVEGETRERSFVRADLFATEDEACTFAVRKAQLIIDQNPSLFSGGTTGTA